MAASNTSKVLFSCAKCEGTGNISVFSHVHGGACFACEGTGKVALVPETDAEALKTEINVIGRQATAALQALSDGNTERAHYLLEPCISRMFTIGTENAREILDTISAGEWFDGGRMEEGKADPKDAAALRAWVIARGRAIKAG